MDSRVLPFDGLLRNVQLATMCATDAGNSVTMRDAAIAWRGGHIVWMGADKDLPRDTQSNIEIDGAGAWVTPGLIDCHTHLVYAGNRVDEWERRLNGATYAEIAAAGGGIRSTVSATRAASDDTLFTQSRKRLLSMLRDGVTTVEIKSGYGLSLDAEAKMLRAARQLGASGDVSVQTTFLGAHALPAEYAGRADEYVDHIVHDMLPALHAEGLVDAVDAFCENIAFTTAQVRRVFEAARALKLPVKLHAEQLSDSDGAALVAEFGGLSADHLEYLSQRGIAAMAAAGTVAVLLPGAFYFLRETKLPPIAALRAAKVPMAVATDCNPGTSPMTSIRTAMNMACTLFSLTPDEALRGATINAAQALGLHDRGQLTVGKRADLALWAVDQPAAITHDIGSNLLVSRFVGGRHLPANRTHGE
jgi:imidazolonepropionase